MLKKYLYFGIAGVVAAFWIASTVYVITNERGACERRNLEKTITIKEKQDEIRNNRPDDEQLYDSLFRGTF
jgi:hypothetical protein